MDHVENVEKYAQDCYHPLDIGDVIGTNDKRYVVILNLKLSFGGFSTAWLVPSCRYFALKIPC
jgi:serine/threonine-protein kinase SRPK3